MVSRDTIEIINMLVLQSVNSQGFPGFRIKEGVLGLSKAGYTARFGGM